MNETTGERTRKLDAEIWLILAIVAVLTVFFLAIRDYAMLRGDVEVLKAKMEKQEGGGKDIRSKR